MPYSTQKDVEFWGQLAAANFPVAKGYDYPATVAEAIESADRMIEDYCGVPEGFFNPGGVEIEAEMLNGVDVVYLGSITRFFGSSFYGGTSHLKFANKPVLSITKLEEETSPGSWTTRTEGTNSDYIVVEDGVRFVNNTPTWKYKNIRVTYKCGYKTTPGIVAKASGRLAAAILQRVLDSQVRVQLSISGQSTSPPEDGGIQHAILTDAIKEMLKQFKRPVVASA